MAKWVLQVNFKYNGPFAELSRVNAEAARQIAQALGLRWKIWLTNEEKGEVGSIYLFDDEPSVPAYLAWRTTQWKSIPAISNISVKQFKVVDKLTKITRGPVK